MFSGAFAERFAGRGAAGAAAGFASCFAASFAGLGVPVAGYVGPCMAQAALAGGAAWSVVGSALVVDGRRLIGPAGKVYAFASAETAERWALSAAIVPVRESQIIASLAPSVAEAWKAAKRTRLEIVAARVVNAAAMTADSEKRAALIAEAGYLLGKWS